MFSPANNSLTQLDTCWPLVLVLCSSQIFHLRLHRLVLQAGKQKTRAGTHMHPDESIFKHGIPAVCPTWLPAQVCECVLTSLLTGTSSSNSCFHVTYPPTDTRTLTIGLKANICRFLVLNCITRGQNIDHFGIVLLHWCFCPLPSPRACRCVTMCTKTGSGP